MPLHAVRANLRASESHAVALQPVLHLSAHRPVASVRPDRSPPASARAHAPRQDTPPDPPHDG